MSDKTPSVTVFSTPTCPWCTLVKQHLDAHGVTFTDVDVAEDYAAAMRMVAKSGQMGVPQIWIDDEVIIGFDQRRLNELLELA